MHFFRDDHVTDFCSCKIGIQYLLYISSVWALLWLLSPLRFDSLALLPWMACMQALQEQKPVTKKLLFLEAPQNS